MSKVCIGGKLIANGKTIPTSKAVECNGFVYVSGQLAFESDGTIMEGDTSAQTTRCLELIQGILKEAGLEMADIIKCNCWISEKSEFGEFNAAYAQFFPENPPARTTILSPLVLDGAKVEIEAIACK